jgi:hypothetical protein
MSAPAGQIKADGPRPAAPIAIEAVRFIKAQDGAGLTWHAIPNLGAGAGAVIALPQGRPETTPADAVYLQYRANLTRAGDATVALHLLPTLQTSGGVDIRIGVSVDDGDMQTLAMRLTPSPGPPTMQEQRDWEKAVINNEFVLEAKFPDLAKGRHAIKVWRLDDNAVLAKLIVTQ